MLTLLVAVGLITGFSLQIKGFNSVGNTASVLANFVLRMFNVEIETLEGFEKLGCQTLGLLIMVTIK